MKRRWVRVAIALLGSFAATLTLCVGTMPAPVEKALQGGSLAALLVFVAVAVAGYAAITWVPVRTYAWAAPVGLLMAAAELAGVSLLRPEADLWLLRPSGWSAAHAVGTAYLCVLGVGVILHAAQRSAARPSGDAGRAWPSRFVASLSGPRPWPAIAALFGALVAARLPLLVIWWPGLILFDTYRSLASVDGASEWTSYEPVGHTLLIALWSGIWHGLGLSDTAALALAATAQLLASSAALTFMLWRISRWGSRTGLWWGALAWIALNPALAMAAITIVKDVPFLSAFVVFLTSVAEISFAIRRGDRRLWPWVVLVLSGAAMMMLRNNGVYVVVLGLLLLVIPFLRMWKRTTIALAACVAVFGLYAGVLTPALHVRPGPKTEIWSVPLQQIARIARDHHTELSAQDRSFVDSVFARWDADDVGEAYRPEISDPIKADAQERWDTRTTGEFLHGWWRLVSEYPGSAATATLANTVGYWAPGSRSFDGVTESSANDVRGIHLDIASSTHPDSGVRGFVLEHRLLGDGLRSVPVVGMALSPGTITWAWLLAVVVMLRRRDRIGLAFAIPAAVLLLTFLAGPVSGGMRYSLGFFAALPIPIAVALLPESSGRSPLDARRSQRTGVSTSPTASTLP